MNFAKEVGELLFKGRTHHYIVNFFNELSLSLDQHLSSEQIKKISNSINTAHSKKLAEEKKKDGKKTAKQKGPALNQSKALNKLGNQKMMNDFMGDDYGDEDEEGDGIERVEYDDFM